MQLDNQLQTKILTIYYLTKELTKKSSQNVKSIDLLDITR